MSADPTKKEKSLEQTLLDAETNANAKYIAEDAQRQATDSLESSMLQTAQTDELNALQGVNKAQYKNQGQIIRDIQGRINASMQKDEDARKREEAFRYISGLGDTLSSVANLVGVANKASNQQQVYNSNAIVQRAEEARKARKLEMDDLNKRLDEMTARHRDMIAAGSLKEAELKAKQAREKMQLEMDQRKAGEEAKRYADSQVSKAVSDARAQWNADRAFNATQEAQKVAQEQWNKTYNMQYSKFKQEEDKNTYNFTLNNESIDVPKEKLNDVNVERIWNLIPKEYRDKIKGETYTEYTTNEYGEEVRKSGHKPASLAQKLALIGTFADLDPRIKDEIIKLADGKSTKVKPTTAAAPSGYSAASTQQYPPFGGVPLTFDTWKNVGYQGVGTVAENGKLTPNGW